jgi:hypothetical protein
MATSQGQSLQWLGVKVSRETPIAPLFLRYTETLGMFASQQDQLVLADTLSLMEMSQAWLKEKIG